MTKPKVTIACNTDGDWEGLYIDGVNVYQGHDIPNEVLLKALGIEYKRTREYTEDEMDEMGCEFPLNESDLP